MSSGEPGYETDTGKLKVGDGSTAWVSLGYFSGGGGGVTFGTPAVVLGTSAAAGSTDEAIRRDSTIVAFDATVPTTQAFGDTAAAGSAAVAARRDHKHAMPATPTSVSGNAGTATALQTARNIDGQAFNGTADITVIAPGTHAATGKTTPIDADEFPIVDTAASNVLKKVSLTNLKAYLKTYFDTLYTVSSGAAPVGVSELIYRYTVAGSDKDGIDTGVDTAQAGSNDWTAGDLLEIFLYLRTDESAATSSVDIAFNNDTSGVYDEQILQGANTTASAARVAGLTSFQLSFPGSTYAANYFGVGEIVMPAYADTVGYKTAAGREIRSSTTNTAMAFVEYSMGYRSTSAITRVKVDATTSGKKLIVGSKVLIYKRRSA